MDGDQHSQRVRDFNRFYTRQLGLLREGLLGSPYSLTEARVLFEIANSAPTTAAELSRLLDIDAGHLSRILERFQRSRLIGRRRSRDDARRRVIRLTKRGRTVFTALDRKATAQVQGMLDRLTPLERSRLVDAMVTVREILEKEESDATLRLRFPRPGDYGWIVERHGVLYALEYGWDERFEALVARIVADFAQHHDPVRERAWIAEIGGEPVGSVLCVRKSNEVAKLRVLLVEPAARGHGVGSRLVDECIRFAQDAGYRELVLWTNKVLDAARRIYERAGFELANEEEREDFGGPQVFQEWRLRLRS